MKIIKRGKIEDREITDTCYKCSTEFSYTGIDIHIDRDGNYVICPVCGAFIAV